MSGVGCISFGVIEHRFDGCGNGDEVREAGKHRAVADVVLEEKRGALGGLQGMKFAG